MPDWLDDFSAEERARIERFWHEHRTRQILRGLELTPLQRLNWLEDNLAEMREWLGRARDVSPGEPGAGA
jgi:hypothetical protein